MKRIAIALCILLMGVVVATRRPSTIAACEDWLDSMECGSYDFTSQVDCKQFESATCDLSDYFECLTDNTRCDEAKSLPDVSAWNTCMSKSKCG